LEDITLALMVNMRLINMADLAILHVSPIKKLIKKNKSLILIAYFSLAKIKKNKYIA